MDEADELALREGDPRHDELQRLSDGVWARFWALGDAELQRSVMQFFSQLLDMVDS
jgi:hypothetical protein